MHIPVHMQLTFQLLLLECSDYHTKEAQPKPRKRRFNTTPGSPSTSASAPKTLEEIKKDCIALGMKCRNEEHELKMKFMVEEHNIKMEIAALKKNRFEKQIISLDAIINAIIYR